MTNYDLIRRCQMCKSIEIEFQNGEKAMVHPQNYSENNMHDDGIRFSDGTLSRMCHEIWVNKQLDGLNDERLRKSLLDIGSKLDYDSCPAS